MAKKHPSQVFLDRDEGYRANRIRLAHYFGIRPHDVDMLPVTDYDDAMEVLYADSRK